MKKNILLIIALLVSVFALTACGSKVEVPGETDDEKYEYVFKNAVEAGKDCDGIIDELLAAKITKYKLSKTEAKKSYLSGYKNKTVTEYTESVTIAPNQVSVTYVLHVFYSENPETLLEQLKANYDDGSWGCYSINNGRAQYYSVCGNYVLAVIYPTN